MRENAASTDQLFQRRATSVASISAVEKMRSYAAIARDYANNTERVSTAFDTLCANLSEAQTQAVASAKPHKQTLAGSLSGDDSGPFGSVTVWVTAGHRRAISFHMVSLAYATSAWPPSST